MDSAPDIASFIARWQNSGAAERANYQLFLSELCDRIGVARPDPTKPDDAENAYVFERSVTFHHPDGTTSTGRIDLYKRACFVLEAKQGVEKREAAEALAEATRAKAKAAKKGTAQRGSAAWDEAMLKAHGQAEQYARALPASEGRPPLLIVVDGDREQAQGGTAGFAGAVLSRDRRDLRYVEQCGELHLRAAKLKLQCADGFRGDCLDGGGRFTVRSRAGSWPAAKPSTWATSAAAWRAISVFLGFVVLISRTSTDSPAEHPSLRSLPCCASRG